MADTKTIRVHLADAVTDVLVWLVDQHPAEWWTTSQVTAAVAPTDAVSPRATVANALTMLHSIGYVVRNDETYSWAATVEGQQAVEQARSATSSLTSDGGPS